MKKHKFIIKYTILSILIIFMASLFHPFIKRIHADPGLELSIIPLFFFLALINIILNKSIKSLIGTLIAMVSLVLISLSYKYLPVNNLIKILIIFSYIVPVAVIAITRAANIGGGYKEILSGAILGYMVGMVLFAPAFIIFLLIASLFVDIMQPAGYIGTLIMTIFVTMPLGLSFWFFIGLAEQFYYKKKNRQVQPKTV